MVSVKKIILLFTLLVGWGRLFAQNDSTFSSNKLAAFKLYNVATGKQASLTIPGISKHFSLFFFLSPECPLSLNYLPSLNSLQEGYNKHVRFYGIIPGKAYSGKTIKEFATKYDVQFPLLIDSLKSLTKYLRASVTPEVILLNEDNNLIYRGAVDDLLMGLGKRRIKASNEFLKNALTLSLENKTVAIKRTKPKGCKINDY